MIISETLEGHTYQVYSVAFNHDGTKIVSASNDDTIRVWNVNTGECVLTLEGHTGGVNSVAFNHDGTKIVSGSVDETIRVWNADTGSLLNTLEGHKRDVQSVAFNHDGTKIVSGGKARTIRVWNVDTGECILTLGEKWNKDTLKGHTESVNSVGFNHDGTKIVSGSNDETIRVWNVDTGVYLSTLKGHTNWVNSVGFNHDGTKIVSGSCDETIRVWNVDTGVCLSTLKGHTDGVNSVAFNHDGTKIVSGSRDKRVRIWNVPLFMYTFTENLYSNDKINWLKDNEISYTVNIKKDTLIFHVSRKFHPLFLDITVSSQGYKVERPGNLLLEDMITKEACDRVKKQGYETIENLMVDLYRSFAYTKIGKTYEYKLKF